MLYTCSVRFIFYICRAVWLTAVSYIASQQLVTAMALVWEQAYVPEEATIPDEWSLVSSPRTDASMSEFDERRMRPGRVAIWDQHGVKRMYEVIHFQTNLDGRLYHLKHPRQQGWLKIRRRKVVNVTTFVAPHDELLFSHCKIYGEHKVKVHCPDDLGRITWKKFGEMLADEFGLPSYGMNHVAVGPNAEVSGRKHVNTIMGTGPKAKKKGKVMKQLSLKDVWVDKSAEWQMLIERMQQTKD